MLTSPRDGSAPGPSRFVLTALFLLMTYDSASMFVHLIRVSLYPTMGVLDHWFNGLLIGISIFCIRYQPRFAVVNLVLFFLLFYGLLVSAVRGTDIGRPLVGQVYHWVVMIAGLNLGYCSNLSTASMGGYLKRMSSVVLWGTLLGFVALEGYRVLSGEGIYMGYPSSQLVLPLAFFICSDKWKLSLLASAMMILSAKRGPIGAGMFIWSYLPFVRQARSFLRPLLLGTVVLAALVGAGWMTLLGISEMGVFGEESPLGRATAKFLLTFQEFESNPTLATAGRDVELVEAYNLLKSGEDVLFGLGYGWFIDLGGRDPQHYIHVSYTNYILNYGLVGTLLFGYVMITMVATIGRGALRAGARSELKVILAYLLGTLIIAWSSSHLSVSFLFWTILGIGVRLGHLDELEVLQNPSLGPLSRPPGERLVH